MTRLDAPTLGRRLSGYRQDLFRLEVLPQYEVASDGGDFERWLAGEAEPTWERKNEWLATLRTERAAGKTSRRVRILSEHLTPYERYACEWGYALNAEAGEDIRVLHRGEHVMPSGIAVDHDFWIVDGTEVVAMRYDDAGRFEFAEVLSDEALPVHLETRDRTWAAGEAFTHWWGRHPELHRTVAS